MIYTNPELFLYCFFVNENPFSYQILAPGPMGLEKDGKKCAGICLETTGLDPELYRLGHTKARKLFHKTKSKSFDFFYLTPTIGTKCFPI